MALFDLIPQRFFGVLTSSNRFLYLRALFVIREAFKTSELTIIRDDLLAMIMEELGNMIVEADFSAEIEEDGEISEPYNLSGKAHLLARHLIATGWIEEEQGRRFERYITIPDYSIRIINLLYDLSQEKTNEYNSYVYSTYASLKSMKENRDYMYNALFSAYQNTENLVDSLKILFNNIKRYQTRALKEASVSGLLNDYFNHYMDELYNPMYYPLKTIDSVPRFQPSIIQMCKDLLEDPTAIEEIAMQGVKRRAFESPEKGEEKAHQMVDYILNTYEGIQSMISAIDQKHSDYTRISLEKVTYFLNEDLSSKGKLINLLKNANDDAVMEKMSESLACHSHGFIDQSSLYNRSRKSKKAVGEPLKVAQRKRNIDMEQTYLQSLRKQYSNARIDAYVRQCMGDSACVHSEDMRLDAIEDFILLLLASIRGTGNEKGVFYHCEFEEGNVVVNGYDVPRMTIRRK